jgi:uncharacterized membrane protein
MKEQSKKYQIRFNTTSTSEDDRWRLIEDGKETLISDIVVNGHVFTTKDWIESTSEYKWHISCEGFCVVKNNVAYVTTVKEESVLTRHILKTISYRILGTLTTVIVAYSLGASLELSSLLGVGELILKPVIYFLHERLWYSHIRVKVRGKYGE